MAHNINRMVYAGDVPWHGIGTKLPANGTYEEIVRAAGFYDAVERPVYFGADDKGIQVEKIPGMKALVRGDTGDLLSTVSESYHVVQFSQVADALIRAAGNVGAIFHTAGTLGRNGSRGWMLAELPNPIRVKGDESEIRKYLLGTAAHDGHHGVDLANVATRVVCQNTLGVALREQDNFRVSIWHSKGAGVRLESAAEAFAKLAYSYDRFGEVANQLASTTFSDTQMRMTVNELFPLPEEGDPSKLLTEKRDRVLGLFESGTGIGAGIRGTAWAAFQAWTEYADHFRVTRTDQTQSERLQSIWMGPSAALKEQALSSIASVAGLRLTA